MTSYTVTYPKNSYTVTYHSLGGVVPSHLLISGGAGPSFIFREALDPRLKHSINTALTPWSYCHLLLLQEIYANSTQCEVLSAFNYKPQSVPPRVIVCLFVLGFNVSESN